MTTVAAIKRDGVETLGAIGEDGGAASTTSDRQAGRVTALDRSPGLPVVDIAAAREAIRRLLAEGETPAKAAYEVRHSVHLESEAEDFIYQLGWTRLAGMVQEFVRTGAEEDAVARPRVNGHFVARGKSREDVLRRVRMVVGGLNKPLIEMTLADLTVLRQTAASQAEGWLSQERFHGVAVGLLNLHGVDRVDKLPAKALMSLRAAAKEVTSW